MGCFPLKEIKACVNEREFIRVSRIFKMLHPWSHPKGECSGTKKKQKNNNSGKGRGAPGKRDAPRKLQSRAQQHLSLSIPTLARGTGSKPRAGKQWSREKANPWGAHTHPQEGTWLTEQMRKMGSECEERMFSSSPRGQWLLGHVWCYTLYLTRHPWAGALLKTEHAFSI